MDDSRAPHGRTPRLGVLLVNLGSPQAPTPAAIRRYLREFLSDPRVIELPRILWLTILYLFVLPLRPRRIAKGYQAIWTAEGSPLAVHTRDLAKRLNKRGQASSSAATRASSFSTSRRSRGPMRNLSFLWSSPNWCRIVASQS